MLELRIIFFSFVVAVIIYFIIKLEMQYREIERKNRKLENLKRENVYLKLSNDENEMLKVLAKLEHVAPEEYIRKNIKEMIK